MALKAFTFTNTADTAYHSFYNAVIATTGEFATDEPIPSNVAGLIINAGAAGFLSDSNNANAAGIPLAANVPLVMIFNDAIIPIKKLFVKGNAVVFSGFLVWR